jgi:hypothetical protein
MQTIYTHIEKRVKELGYTNFSVQPIIIKPIAAKLNYKIEAYNELYFLMGNLPINTRITSDTEAIHVDSTFSSMNIKTFYEFSGLVEIQLISELTDALEFLKVIPQ